MALSQRFFSDAFRDMQRAMSLLDQPSLFKHPAFTHHGGSASQLMQYPAADLVEKSDGFELNVELLGYDKNNIKIDMLDSQTLVVSGSVTSEYHTSDVDDTATEDTQQASSAQGDKESTAVTKKEEQALTSRSAPHQFWVNERVSGFFTRSFRLPKPVKPEDIKASFNNGLLKVNLPMSSQNQPASISID